MHHQGRRSLRSSEYTRNEEGNAILMALLLVGLLGALCAAQLAVSQKNVQASRFFGLHAELRKYAESGVELALYDLSREVSGSGGKIGCVNWTAVNDAGKDGVLGTRDAGEGDGLPTPGEPNVAAATIGSGSAAMGLVVHVEDSEHAGVKHIVSTAVSGDTSAQVEVYARKTEVILPRVAAIYLDPNVALDLTSGAFLIDGHDTDPDGSRGPEAAVFGVATKPGSVAGANAAALLSQVPARLYSRIDGKGGAPSIGEAELDFQGLLASLKPMATEEFTASTFSPDELGNADEDDYRVTVVEGDLHLSGDTKGAGVLIVEGSLTLTGRLSYEGLVLVVGDLRLSGSGSEAKVYGALMIGQSLVTEERLRARSRGAAQVYYSSQALSNVEGALKPRFRAIYYAEK